ncbi:MAG: hypothetical protein F6K10_32085 [Moorea sp. SIO2B7]|nr:hypothetical protein [Moorena sp. SIO2B7]
MILPSNFKSNFQVSILHPPYNNQPFGDYLDTFSLPNNSNPGISLDYGLGELEISSTTDPNLIPKVEQAGNLVRDYLINFAVNPDHDEITGIAFEENYDQEIVESLRQDFAKGDLSNLSEVKIIDSDILGDANGAYAAQFDTIFLSDDFVRSHSIQDIADVLLEEIGHGIDKRINNIDAAGDEGDIYSRLVQGESIYSADLALLKQEDDSGSILWNGQEIFIEQSSTLEVIQDSDGRMEMFAVGKDNKVYHRFQTAKDGAFSDWYYMGVEGKEVPVEKNIDGRMEVFIIDDNSIRHFRQEQQNGVLVDSGYLSYYSGAKELEIGRNADGRLEVFTVANDGTIWHNWQQWKGSEYWSGWYQMDGAATEIEVAENKNGMMELFAVGTDGKLWQNYQQYLGTDQNGDNWGAFVGWHDMRTSATDVEIGTKEDGSLELFVTDKYGQLKNRWQYEDIQPTYSAYIWNNPESYWNDLGLKVKEVEVATNAQGKLEIFAIDFNTNEVKHRFQTSEPGLTN